VIGSSRLVKRGKSSGPEECFGPPEDGTETWRRGCPSSPVVVEED
jgi:hypothetical protein